MKKKEISKHPVYSDSVVQFVAFGTAFCYILENESEFDKKGFISSVTRVLAMLYFRATTLPVIIEESIDGELGESVTEELYESIRATISKKLEGSDEYLEVFTEDMKYSDTPVIQFISEDLCDIYQDLKNFIENYKTEELSIMNNSLFLCKQSFETYWGQKLVNVLRALHSLCYAQSEEDDDELC